jgi:hypothetical protein
MSTPVCGHDLAMGAVLPVLLVVLVAVPVVVAMCVWAARALGAGPAPPPALVAESRDAYRNHQGMARWIERQLNDDMVRVTLTAADQEKARDLLAEFYDERGR